jgi:hypothetical protein
VELGTRGQREPDHGEEPHRIACGHHLCRGVAELRVGLRLWSMPWPLSGRHEGSRGPEA